MTKQYSNTEDVSLALAVWLANDNYDHDNTPNTISTTTLLRPLRQIILSPRIPTGEALPDLGSMLKNRMGTAIHDAIENAWINNYAKSMRAIGTTDKILDRVEINPCEKLAKKEGVIPIYLEQRLTRKLGKWTVTGKFDFVEQGEVQDFKSTSVFAYQKQTSTNKWVEQGSVYRWLDPRIITKDTMKIHYIFTDWKSSFAGTDPTYPTKPFYTQNLNLLSHHATDNLISKKLGLIDKYWDADEPDIPECTAEELWRSPPQYKYYKNGDINSKRSTKNFNTNQEAVIYMSGTGKGIGAVKTVPGQVTACKYCPAFTACTQKDNLIAAGDLIISEGIK